MKINTYKPEIDLCANKLTELYDLLASYGVEVKMIRVTMGKLRAMLERTATVYFTTRDTVGNGTAYNLFKYKNINENSYL